jgi:hypothetical protein
MLTGIPGGYNQILWDLLESNTLHRSEEINHRGTESTEKKEIK